MAVVTENTKIISLASDYFAEKNRSSSIKVKTISDVLGETFVDLFSEIKNYFSPSEVTTKEPSAQEYYIPEKTKMDDLNTQLQEYFSPSNPIRMEYYIEDPDVYKQRIKKEGQATTEQPPVEVEGINTQALRESLDPDQQVVLETNNQPRTDVQNRAAQEYLGVAVDGIWGNISKRSLINWQSKNGLSISGELTDETLAAMKDPNTLDPRNKSTRKSVLNEAGTAPDAAKVKAWAKENISDPVKASAFVATVEAETGNRDLTETPYTLQRAIEVFVNPYARSNGTFGPRMTARLAALNALPKGSNGQPDGDAIFDVVYGNRQDLGNTQAGDGSRFKGRGLIQITGRTNYEAVGKILGIDLVSNPELVNDPKYAAPAAMAYLTNKNRASFFLDTLTRDKLKDIVGHSGGTTEAQDRWDRAGELENEMYP